MHTEASVIELTDAELEIVNGGLTMMTEPIKWRHVGGGMFLGFNETTGLWAGLAFLN
jgi:hypothetical protein